VNDGLRVGEIRKYPLCGLRDDILTVRHGVPRFLQSMMGKSGTSDKRRCPQGPLQGRNEAPGSNAFPRDEVSPICGKFPVRYGRSRQ
jgi:hypothetical protein